MNTILLSVEIIAVVLAAVFGVLWLNDPTARYEPITFLCLLFGGAVVDIIRRLLPEPGRNHEHLRDLAAIKNQVADMLALLRDSRVQKETTSPQPQVDQSTERPEPLRDPLTERIHSLISSRNNIIDKLKALAALRGVTIDEAQPAAACKTLAIPNPFDKAIIEVLDFTHSFSGKDNFDIQHSTWVDGMADAVTRFLDHMISTAH